MPKSVELSFYEGLCRRDPENWAARKMLAETYTKEKFLNEALKEDMALCRHFTDDPSCFYNLACSYAMIGRIQESVETLKKAVHMGFDDLDWMVNDFDLRDAFESEEFKDWLATDPIVAQIISEMDSKSKK